MSPVLNAILLGMIPLSSGTVIAYWWWKTRGTWMKYPAGRSLMGLLGIIFVGFGFGVVNFFLGQYPARLAISFTLYLAFITAIILIGFTIRAEMRTGKKKLRDKHPLHTGPLTVPVAAINKEEPDDDQ